MNKINLEDILLFMNVIISIEHDFIKRNINNKDDIAKVEQIIFDMLGDGINPNISKILEGE